MTTSNKRDHDNKRSSGGRTIRRFGWALALGVLLFAGVLVFGMVKLNAGPVEAWRTLRSRPMMEIVRHAEFRLIGHPALETMLQPLIGIVRHQLEREPAQTLVDLGKGQQAQSLQEQTFAAGGAPHESHLSDASQRRQGRRRSVGTVADLQSAFNAALPGETLELAPGRYRIDRPLVTGNAGESSRPITVRAEQPGSVQVIVTASQAIVVSQPFWVFENLQIRGDCPVAEDCQHAFRVVGGASGTVIRNNTVSNFNVHIKVIGEEGRWPDEGLVQFNTLANDGPRHTDRGVSPIDIVAANRWHIVDNIVRGFIKTGGNGIALGISLKGAGQGGRVERNLVVCTPRDISQPGLRLGISIGGIGTDMRFCRDGQCATEFTDATVANNVVAHCNDVGIDINHSTNALVAYNTLVNTLGILVREKPSSASVQGNLLEGSIRIRNGGVLLQQEHNLVASTLTDVLAEPDALDLRWRELPAMLPAHPLVPADLCGQRRPTANPPGAMLSARCVASAPGAQ